MPPPVTHAAFEDDDAVNMMFLRGAALIASALVNGQATAASDRRNATTRVTLMADDFMSYITKDVA